MVKKKAKKSKAAIDDLAEAAATPAPPVEQHTCGCTTTRLFTIKAEIEKRHGPITNLKICKDHFAEGNELTDDMLTLHDYGIDGSLPHDKEVVCLIYYDFKPTQHDNPLLLATEQY
ncbi:hypothetical protein Ae201684P_006904 [Aphanomyces euteiches]|nr:hypothetical protein Ae201684P_006904 [Aphanomyces euteiches]